MGPLKGQLCFFWGGGSPFGLQEKGMELSSRPPGGSFEKDQGKWHGTGKKEKRGKKKKRLKRIPTNPERRLSPSALGKGELEGSGLRLSRRILLLQSCQKCIHYFCPETGGRKFPVFNASQGKDGRVLDNSFGFFLKIKTLLLLLFIQGQGQKLS